MASDSSDHRLLLTVRAHNLRVSHVSSTLRVIQAAVREIARTVDQSSSHFEGTSQPILLVDTSASTESCFTLSFYFADSDDAPIRDLSEQVLGAFMDEFARVLASRSQLGLWGRTARGSGSGELESDIARRLDDLKVLLRRFGTASLKLGDRSITFDGDTLAIE